MQDILVTVEFWIFSVVCFESSIVNTKFIIQTNKCITYLYLVTIFYVVSIYFNFIYIKIKNENDKLESGSVTTHGQTGETATELDPTGESYSKSRPKDFNIISSKNDGAERCVTSHAIGRAL